TCVLRTGAVAATAPAEGAPGGDRGDPVEGVARAHIPRDGVPPGEDRGADGLVVADAGEALSRPSEHPAHDTHAEPLERGHRQMAVEIVAVAGVDVGPHPQPRVGDPGTRRGSPFGDPRQRRGYPRWL